MKKRSLFWDNYKGILIFLVVFGHCIYSYASKHPDNIVQNIYMWIYSFHMPAFIFCSGYFSKSEHSRSKESLMKLFLYYVVFNTAMALFAYFYMGTKIKLLNPYYSYWYILSMIAWRLVIGDLGKVKGLLVFSLAAALLLGYWSEFSNLLSLRRTVAFFVFFAAGYLLDREKAEAFLARRKPWMMALGAAAGLVMAAAAFWAVENFGVKNMMTMMGAYKNNTDIFYRVLLFVISTAAIVTMFFVVPNRKIPLLSQMGRNSLLIYLAHRAVTILYYKELFPAKTYTNAYLLYALIATVVICVVFGSEKLNRAVASVFDKAAAAVVEPKNRMGGRIKAAMLLLLVVLLCVKAGPLVAELTAKSDEQTQQEVQTETAAKEETKQDDSDEIPVLSAEQEAAIDDAVKIAYVGDLILLKDQVTSAYDAESGAYDFDAMFEYAAPYLTDADLALGVFEGPCAGEEAGYSTSNYGDGLPLYLNFPDEFAQAVKDAGIDVVTTANNHLLDMGVDGAMRTLDVLDEVGLQHSGSYRNQEEKDSLLIVEADGVKIAVLTYTNAVNYYKSVELAADLPYLTSLMPYTSNDYYDVLVTEIEDDFAQAKASDADVILVMAHMGSQFKTKTNAFQDKWNALFAELGADIILGDHAHIIQPIEYIGDTVVVNCPGNFANSYISYDGDATAIAEIYIDRDTKEVVAAAAIPMYTQEAERGYFRALPIYDIMTNAALYDELWSRDQARIQEVQKLITNVMVGEEISLKNVRERYFFIDNRYHQQNRTLFPSSADYADTEFYQLIDEAESITFIGDSITEGTKNDGHPWYEPMMEDFSGKEVVNISKGGYTVKRIMDEYGADILASESELYVIALGTNDIRYRNETHCAMTAEAYVEALDQMVALIKESSPAAKIVFLAPWMTLENDTISSLSHEEKNEMTDAYSASLHAYAEENGYGFINANPYLRTFFAGTAAMLYTNDGIHPNATVGVELYSMAVLESSN